MKGSDFNDVFHALNCHVLDYREIDDMKVCGIAWM